VHDKICLIFKILVRNAMVKLQVGFLTDKGSIRKENEDSVWAQILALPNQPPLGLFVVCDGMGGHMGGKFASYWAVEAIKAEFANLFASKDPRATVVLSGEDIKAVHEGTYTSPKPMDNDLQALTNSAIQKANKVVYDYARHKPKTAANAGTTITMMATNGEQSIIANVGDSRAYLLRGKELVQISKDHSLVANLVSEGQILPEEVYTHPRRNMIYRYLGQKGLVEVDVFHNELQPGDSVLLCSDGLWEMIRSDSKIAEIIEGSEDPQAACKALVEAANEGGGEDNISAIVIEVS
jgi:PPM family protein phosphatase